MLEHSGLMAVLCCHSWSVRVLFWPLLLKCERVMMLLDWLWRDTRVKSVMEVLVVKGSMFQ